MNILCLGISHHTASVELREQISLPEEGLSRALRDFAARRSSFYPVSELVILATCSRFELYAMTAEGAQDTEKPFAPLLRLARRLLGLPRARLEPHLYRYAGPAAVQHLCRVAAGLDSMVLGEAQILGQVSAAHRLALEQGGARHVLSSLFRSAVHAGKRVRTETAIGRHPTHMSAVAVHLAEELLGDLTLRHALVIGTGEIGRQSIRALRDHGLLNLAIASRSPERAEQAGREWNARPVTLAGLEDALVQADLVLCAVRQEEVLIPYAVAARAAARRADRPLLLVDLAMPRNIDPAIRAGAAPLANVHLFDLDDIQARLAHSLANRQSEVPRAEAIVDEETASFSRWLAVIPVVGELHRRAESIRQQEVGRALHYLQDADPLVVEQIERLSQSLVRKLLHEPTARLRHESDHACLESYMVAITSLFDLPDSGAAMQGKGEAH